MANEMPNFSTQLNVFQVQPPRQPLFPFFNPGITQLQSISCCSENAFKFPVYEEDALMNYPFPLFGPLSHMRLVSIYNIPPCNFAILQIFTATSLKNAPNLSVSLSLKNILTIFYYSFYYRDISLVE